MLAQALARARRAAGLSGGALLVGFSGGKDALATADVLVRSEAFQRLELFAMELVKGLECFRSPIDRFAEQRGLKVHYVPHWDLSRLLKHGILRHHTAGAEKLRIMKLKDVELALSQETGIDWFGYGERADDSYARRLYTRKDDGISTAWRRAWPIWDWKTAHVVSYLRARRIPLPERIGATRAAGGSGITLDPLALLQLKKGHPRDYLKILEVFPLAEASVYRAERGDFEPVPVVPDGAGASAQAQGRAVQPARHQRRRA